MVTVWECLFGGNLVSHILRQLYYNTQRFSSEMGHVEVGHDHEPATSVGLRPTSNCRSLSVLLDRHQIVSLGPRFCFVENVDSSIRIRPTSSKSILGSLSEIVVWSFSSAAWDPNVSFKNPGVARYPNFLPRIALDSFR